MHEEISQVLLVFPLDFLQCQVFVVVCKTILPCIHVRTRNVRLLAERFTSFSLRMHGVLISRECSVSLSKECVLMVQVVQVLLNALLYLQEVRGISNFYSLMSKSGDLPLDEW